MMKKYFEQIDFSNFWNNNKYYLENYVAKPLTDEMIAFTEKELGYKLPQSYIQLLKNQNGGSPNNRLWINENAKANEIVEIEITGFFSIDKEKKYSLFGEFSNEFWFKEWGYPKNIGIIIADTISAGHEMIYLDYRECGKEGEPKVSVVLQESDYEIQVIANSFEEFILGLVNADEYYEDEE